ncbi:peptidase S24-like family protein [Desulfovibrio sp. A2]|nr:peptidase S24-like family protein [Desulfovibrio sp. A2]
MIECADCELVMVPMVEARLSAGTGSFETGGDIERRYAFRTDFLLRKGAPSSMVLMRVDGDSMDPYVLNGDVVLIDQSQREPRAGKVYAVGVEDVVYLKRVNAVPGKIILSSYNPDYPPIEVDARGDLSNGIRIIGRAVWVGRELN